MAHNPTRDPTKDYNATKTYYRREFSNNQVPYEAGRIIRGLQNRLEPLGSLGPRVLATIQICPPITTAGAVAGFTNVFGVSIGAVALS